MNTFRKRAAAAALSLIAALCLIFVAVASARPRAEISDSGEMFVSADGVNVAANGAAPDTFQTYDGGTAARDFDLEKRGVLLSAASEGASVSLAPEFAGDFELTFRVYSSVTYHPATENDYNSSAVVMSPYIDLREIFFDFEDENGNAFTVAIAGGEKYNIITPAARVIVAGTAVGYHYATDAKVPSETGLKNSGGYYTRIGGTTFCNVARRGGAYTSENSMPVTFGYNAESKEIYVIHYGTSTTEETYRAVYDLDAEDSGLLAIPDFGKYSVRVRFGEIAEGKTANVVLYELNGQSLAGENFTDNAGAQTLVSASYHAVAGEKYVLPEPSAFDVLEGELAFSGDVQVSRGGKTYALYAADGAALSSYEPGCYFLPDEEGTYEISYTAKDGAGNAGKTKTVSVRAFASVPETSFAVEGSYRGLTESAAVGAGSALEIYAASVTSAIFADGRTEPAEAALYFNGELYKDTRFTADESREVALDDAGEYTLVYFVAGYENLKQTVAFTVSETAPVYALSSDLPAKAAVGSSFNPPSLTATLGGESKRATAALYAPDGSAVTLQNGSAVLAQAGEYKLVYYVRFATTYTYTAYFTAAYSAAGAFAGDGSAVSAETGDSGSLYPSKAYGSVLTFTAEDKFAEYTKVIDLSKNTRNDPLISVMVLPSVYGELDFWQFTVRLTDVNDARNYVNITAFKGSWGNEFSYIRAGGAEQILSGWEMGSVLTAYNTGCPVNYSFTGESLAGTEFLTLYYDYEENAVYVDNIKREGYEYGNQVIDLDSLQCFSENALFGGFSTGEVYLSVSVQYLQGESARLLVGEVNGVSLAQEWIDDETAPKIGVDYGGYDLSSLPQGEVGTAYPVFASDAYDAVEGAVATDVSVYKDYQTAAQRQIAVENGAFLPDESGVYTVVYTAADHSGNSSEVTVQVTVAEELPAFAYTFHSELRTAYFVGETFRLPRGTASGGSGTAQAELTLSDPLGGEVNAENYTFEEDGTYRLTVSFTDFLGRTDETVYEISVTISDSPVVSEVNLYGVMIDGKEYTLPDFTAIDYSEGSAAEPEKRIEVHYGGNVQTLGADRKFVPSVENHGDKITVYYIAENAAGKETSLPYEIAVVKPENELGQLDLSKYFYTEGVSGTEITSEYIEYRTAEEGARLVFANPVIANNLNLEFYVPAAYNAFGGFSVTLTDSEDPSVSVTFSVYKGVAGTNTSFFSCGNDRVQIAGNFYDRTTYGFTISFSNNSLYFLDGNANSSLDKPLVTDGGEPFAGFPGQKVYLSVSLFGVTGESALRVVRVGNQYFSSLTSDRIAPQLQLSGSIATTADIGEPYTAPAAVAADVLDPDATISLTVRKGSETLYEGPIDQPYTFTPTAYGTYNFTYTASAGGRERTVNYLVNVKDKVPPELSLNGEVPKTGAVGTEIALPSASAADNDAEGMRIWIFVTEPKGKMYALGEGVSAFTPGSAGTWLVTYYAEDEYANYASLKYEIEVS